MAFTAGRRKTSLDGKNLNIKTVFQARLIILINGHLLAAYCYLLRACYSAEASLATIKSIPSTSELIRANLEACCSSSGGPGYQSDRFIVE